MPTIGPTAQLGAVAKAELGGGEADECDADAEWRARNDVRKPVHLAPPPNRTDTPSRVLVTVSGGCRSGALWQSATKRLFEIPALATQQRGIARIEVTGTGKPVNIDRLEISPL